MFITLLIVFFFLLLLCQFTAKTIEGMDTSADGTTTDTTTNTNTNTPDCSAQTDIATLQAQYASQQKEIDDLTTQVQSLSDAQTSMVSSIPPANVTGAETDGTTNPDGSENTAVTADNANSAAFFNSM
jgi:hypothetical protein